MSGEAVKREKVKDAELERKSERGIRKEYGRNVTKMGVAQICEGVGFEGVKQSSLDALSEIAIRYISDLGKSATFYANLAGRSDSNVFDILKSFQDLGCFSNSSDCTIILSELSDFVGAVKDMEIPFAQPIPRFPVISRRGKRVIQSPSFMEMGEASANKHIPEWLPAFPDVHTYLSSPLWNQRKLDLRIDKGEQARQRRKAERSLLNLQQRLLSSGLAGPSSSYSHAVAPRESEDMKSKKDAILNGGFERKHVLVKHMFAPAIEALKGSGTKEVSDIDAMDVDMRVVPATIPERRRPVVHFKLKTGKKMLVEDLDVQLRSRVSDKRGSMMGRDDDKDDKKRRAQLILRQSCMDNHQELSQM